ncbi:hypothetical protein JVU11DRAFT_6665 [Chiua virens]|nr:hypothetical protein JVU11DRAFT_6665 [Chiua virens]
MVLHILPTALVTLCIRGYFVYRIYLFVGNKIVVPIIWVIPASVEFVTSILYISYALRTVNGEVQAVGLGALGVNPFLTVGTINLAVSAGVDILIAICMTFLLFRKRSRTRFASTVHLLQRLTVFAVNTGIWPASLALLTIILLHVFPTNIVNYLPYIPLCSVYCNTLLANLNARAYIAGRETTQVIDMDLFSISVSQASESTAVVEQHEVLRFASSAKEDESLVTEIVPALESMPSRIM